MLTISLWAALKAFAVIRRFSGFLGMGWPARWIPYAKIIGNVRCCCLYVEAHQRAAVAQS